MTNDHGACLRVLNYGGRINGWYPANHSFHNIVLAYENPIHYLNDPHFLGAIIGRVAGRIPGGLMDISGVRRKLSLNEGSNHLHGGNNGFSNVFWEYRYEETETEYQLHLSYFSKYGDEGYPGNVHTTVIYALKKDTDKLSMQIEAVSDHDTWLSIANHSYFNLSPLKGDTILNHTLQAPTLAALELDSDLLPTDRLLDSPFDIRERKRIQDIVNSKHPQVEIAHGGVDHFFIFHNDEYTPITLFHPDSNRSLIIETTEPGAVIYTGQKLESTYTLTDGYASPFRGLCVETQRLPEAIASHGKPTCFIPSGEKYFSETHFSLI
nr:aldose epimerase family protein [Geomicrobium halophilum]